MTVTDTEVPPTSLKPKTQVHVVERVVGTLVSSPEPKDQYKDSPNGVIEDPKRRESSGHLKKYNLKETKFLKLTQYKRNDLAQVYFSDSTSLL